MRMIGCGKRKAKKSVIVYLPKFRKGLATRIDANGNPITAPEKRARAKV